MHNPTIEPTFMRRFHLDAVERVLGGLSATLVLWLAMGSLTAIFAIFACNLYQARLDVAESARTASSNLAGAVGQQIARDLAVLDTSLQDLRDGAQNPTLMALPSQLRQLTLFDKAATANGLGTLLLLDANGRVVEQAGSEQPPPVDFSQQSLFQEQARGGVGLFVSRPFVSLLDGEPSIALTRRVERDGQFLGVAVATIRTSYFKDRLSHLDLGSKGTISLFATDGALIMRQPFAASAVGYVAGSASFLRRIASGKAGMTEDVSPIDGIRRRFFYCPVGALPLTIVLGRSVDEIYAAWWRRAAATGVALLLLGNLILVLIGALQIALRHRAVAEAELAALARTDKLTGLANRRHFDETLDIEWRRAGRSRHSLALLLLDIDYFKDFNDIFGHQGGDAVLAAMGACLSRVPKRAADLAARYGGEEFAILLPQTSEADSMRIAETIAALVRDLRQPHPRSPSAMLTVSIGVAVLSPGETLRPADLVHHADAALYEAKRAGRNRVILWQPPLAA